MLDWFTAENIENALLIASSVVGTCALIATITPNKTDDKFVGYLTKAINFLGANFGKAKNDPNS